MMLRSLTLALLASMVMAETVPVGVPTPIENEEAERTEEDWEEDEDDSNIVECTLILLLDDKPSETAWEVRGPLPGVSIAGSAAYDFYEGMERKQMEDTLLLHMGQTYYFLLSDFGQDGIEDGYLKISTDFGSGDITLVEDSTDFGAAKVYMFTVPVPPLASHGDEGEDEPPMDATTV